MDFETLRWVGPGFPLTEKIPGLLGWVKEGRAPGPYDLLLTWGTVTFGF
jgi:hypothetical protein